MGWMVAVTPWPRFTLEERTPGTHWIGGWVSLRTGMNTEAWGRIPCLCWKSNPVRPVCSHTLCCLSYPSVEWDVRVTVCGSSVGIRSVPVTSDFKEYMCWEWLRKIKPSVAITGYTSKIRTRYFRSAIKSLYCWGNSLDANVWKRVDSQ
jgi:hypothetical protein